MMDKKGRNMLFPDQTTSHLQNVDFTPSSYFNMNILEEAARKRKFINLDNKNNPNVSSVICGNNQYYDKGNYRLPQEFESNSNTPFSNIKQAYFQQKEPSVFHETLKEEIYSIRDFKDIGCAIQSEKNEFRSEYSSDPLNTFLLVQDKQQCGISAPYSPVTLKSSSYDAACLAKKLKNNACTTKELENTILGSQEASTSEHINQLSMERGLRVNVCLNDERLTEMVDGFSASTDEQITTNCRRVSPLFSEKIWDGSIKLNTSTTVPAVAFFKSGEKIQDIKWPDHVEIKGKVKLQAFEKFIQELPRSRNRALMVISLCWKVGSCKTGLAGMMEVAKGYRENEKVGFAQIHPGIDLYLCPRSDIILTILAKYGFFKGMTAVEEDQDSFIGCVVWRRGQTSTNSASKAPEGKKTIKQEKSLDTHGKSIRGKNSPAIEAVESEKKLLMLSETEQNAALNPPDSDAGTSIAPTDMRSMITENKVALSSVNSTHTGIFHYSAVQTLASSIPYSCPLVPTQQKTSENMKLADMIPLVSDSQAQFVSPSQMTPVFMHGSSLSISVSQSLGNFGSVPAPGPRPLIPVDSSNFQFRPQISQNVQFIDGSYSSSKGNDLAPSSQTIQQPAILGPPLELLHRLIQSNKKVSKAMNGGIPRDETHIMHHIASRGPTNVLEARVPSLPQIQKTCLGLTNDEKKDDDDDLPEFDFNSACGESDLPMIRFPGCTQQTHFPNLPPINEKLLFKASPSLGDPTPIATATKSFQVLQHVPKPSILSPKLLNSKESLSHSKNFGKVLFEKTPSTESYQSSCQKETKDFTGNSRHGFGFEHKSLWDDDDDDMPEWCPPDKELSEQPPTDITSPLLFHHNQSRDLQPRPQLGLLGPCPTFDAPTGEPKPTRPSDQFAQITELSKPPLEPPRKNSSRPSDQFADMFNRRPAPYASDRRQYRC